MPSPLAGAETDAHEGLVQLAPGPRVPLTFDLPLQLFRPGTGRGDVDLVRHGRVFGKHVHPGLLLRGSHVEKPPINENHVLAATRLDPHRMDRQGDQHGGVARQDADITIDPLGHDYVGLPRPHLAFRRDDVHLEGHYSAPTFSSFSLASIASSIPPTM